MTKTNDGPALGYDQARQSVLDFFSMGWKGPKQATASFVQELEEMARKEPVTPLCQMMTFVNTHYNLNSGIKRMEAELMIGQWRLYFVVEAREKIKREAEGALAAVRALKTRSLEAFRALRSDMMDINVKELSDLSDELQAAFFAVWDTFLIKDENERETAYHLFEKHFPNLSALYFMYFSLAKQRKTPENDVLEAIRHLQEYEEDPAFIVSLADYFKENKDAVHYGKYAVLGYDRIFMGHKTVLNWSNALAVTLNGFQMIDVAAGEKNISSRELLAAEEKTYKDVPIYYGKALADLVRFRPRMKWTEERISHMYIAFFKAMVLPDEALVAGHIWWNSELAYWLDELYQKKAPMGDEQQQLVANLLLFASLKLRNNKERESFRALLACVRGRKLLKNERFSTIYDEMEAEIELSLLQEDDRFSSSFKKAAHSLTEDEPDWEPIFRELTDTPVRDEDMKMNYPHLYKIIDKYRANVMKILHHMSREDARPVSKPYTRAKKKIGRNDPCPCGSGKKFKNCCMGKGIYD